MYRTIRADKVVDTASSLRARVRARFPESGLLRVADELLDVARESQERCRWIARPNVPLRVGAWFLVVAGIVGIAAIVVANVRMTESFWDLSNFVEGAEALLANLVFLGAGIAFLVTLETRIKRGRALFAVNELRALAHIIDMHQLTKDPEMVFGRSVPTQVSPARNMTARELNRYLDYCSEMLSIVSKIGALYVQTFPDSQALSAVDDIESLTNGLSRKIWQKIMILDRYLDREPRPHL
ncbi:MAG TPA: hypothetical protein VJH87_00905 [Vicinamibacteria bacterium]|nr:hypothetical protein [Vicinamibacteria bacterium]